MRDDAAAPMDTPTQEPQGTEPQAAEEAQDQLPPMDGAAPSARRLVARDGQVRIEYVEPPMPSEITALIDRAHARIHARILDSIRAEFPDT